MTSFVRISWNGVNPEDPSLRHCRGVLYAYIAPDLREILYIGKAYGCSVYERWCRTGKESFWDALEDERGITEHAVIVGEVVDSNYRRITEQMITDIEGLLIYRLKPWGNIQSTQSRGITRPGLRVICEGPHWVHERRNFIDR